MKKLDQFPERLIPPCHSFLLPIFLAEFPSGAWVPTKPANFAWASMPPLLRENRKTPVAYVGGDWYSM